MLFEGNVLADRYEITGKIGTGGMSDVYKAKDHKLNRFVAIKVLKQEFSDDKKFVSRFIVEAQSAAGLMHPNIVNVYDVGNEEGLHYIVMELVEGITLKKYIEKKINLSFEETVSIAIQVSMGIEAAHNNHIIHRDIKPQNIIISKEGKVKVTDFGIARAATSDTITSNAMGSVHYISPEQARSGYSDEKSDIYSLGITMFEMLTGRVPFDGDTTVSIAIMHIQEKMPSPSEYVDVVPYSIEQIIAKCCQKQSTRRYQNMGELIVDLKKALITPDDDFVKVVDEQGAKTQMFNESDRSQIRLQTGTLAIIDEEEILKSVNARPTVRNQADDELYADDATMQSGYDIDDDYSDDYRVKKGYDTSYDSDRYEDTYDREYYGDEYEDEYDEVSLSKGRPVRKPQTRHDRQEMERERRARSVKKTPSKSAKDAPKKVKSDKKSSKPARPKNAKNKNSVRNEQMRRQRPNTRGYGEFEEEDDDDMDPRMERVMTVLGIIAALIIACIAIFVVAKMFGVFRSTQGQGAATEQVGQAVSMIEATGMTFEDAKASLKELGLEVRANYVSSSTVDKDQVIDQSIPAGESVATGTVVELTVSSGTDGLVVPDVTNLTEAEARVLLENEGFNMVKDESASDSVVKGNVITQNPASGESAQKGDTVTVIISTGKPNSSVTVPDIRLQTETDAKNMLTDAGLTWSTIDEAFSDAVPIGCVVAQSYAPNVTVPEGTGVSFTLSKGPENGGLALYKCNISVAAPPTYAGGNATVVLSQPDTGNILFQTVTTSFPVAINLTNIAGSQNALVSVTYTISSTVVVEDQDGVPQSTTHTEEKTEYQQVTLSPQQ